MGKKAAFKVVLYYVTPPTAEQLQGIWNFVLSKYVTEERKAEDIEFSVEEDPSLGGGFILKCENEVYNWSTRGRLGQFNEKLQNIRRKVGADEDVISILRTTVDEFKLSKRFRRSGYVTSAGDGIARVKGLERAEYGEILIFASGLKGMVQDIRKEDCGVILFGKDDEIRVWDEVARTGMRAGIPVGDGLLGRVLNSLGEPIDGGKDFESEGFRPIECPAPSITARQPVDTPLETGILSIDSMFPIGRGQRELIIGDRQTGKTSIAIDTIINQKGKGVKCVYVAIGQKASTIARLVNRLKEAGAMDYTVVISSTASDPAPLQYIAPYSGTSIAEFFMHKGEDVLIVYDDLSKHAVAYRALSLLLERSPGREAYPGDVFYLHSRLLERSARLSDELGGGSITALPIIETQAGDVSAYIPTNVISITDGQIYLESELFFLGFRPAVNVGLSVSRVGGAAQTKAMKKAAGSIRIDLAQYREMEVFTQFSSDLDDATKNQLRHGRILMELLKQPLGSPRSMADQVMLLTIVNSGAIDSVPVEMVREFTDKLLAKIHVEQQATVHDIETMGVLNDDEKYFLVELAEKELREFMSVRE
ncbi:MAG: F0F1 ATP synthase subunit alpha [Lachnospiraceae bacterium]|nr:F0F1 ATP synthase subunit alpha [Lachnospiraceae bacterium]MBP3755096.1 F0F1 ATP synthase subunit alpha [Lachnospiraceae bacterium]